MDHSGDGSQSGRMNRSEKQIRFGGLLYLVLKL
jgi:hypothetical protein